MTLAEHRIARIQTRTIQNRYPREVGRNARLDVHGTGPASQIRILTTDQGAVGWGLSWGDEAAVAPLLGRRVAELFDPAVGVLLEEALPLDFALHDLAGVLLGQPVYQMLGGQGPTHIPCYDGAIYIDDILPEAAPRGIEAVLANCRADYALGYRAFKLKIGRGHRWMEAEAGLRRDIEVTRRVREAFPDCYLLVDANDGYTCDGVLRYLEAVADCRLFWVEEPFPENREDLERLRAFLAERSPQTLIADGESNVDLDLVISLAEAGLIDVLIMDIVGFGFTRWRQWMPRLARQGIRTSPHTWGEPLKTYSVGHLAAGLGNVLTIEGIPATSDDVDGSGYRLEQGLLRVPSEPGFGLRLQPS
ncbi:MAG TPA: enolase C-terminal domain-like protein [Chthonomonadaceae bacterium]|nr:enolase C-terminal domain-like protein [Chthonomonadaceae bacterium]